MVTRSLELAVRFREWLGFPTIPHRATSLSSLLGHAYTEHTHALVKVELSPINT